MKSATGFAASEPAADALGDTTTGPAAEPINGSPLDVDSAGLAMAADEPTSRRLTANAAHAHGAAAGTPPSPPAPNHANKLPLKPDTAPRGDAAVIDGACPTASAADAAGATATTSAIAPADVSPAEPPDADSATWESATPTDAESTADGPDGTAATGDTGAAGTPPRAPLTAGEESSDREPPRGARCRSSSVRPISTEARPLRTSAAAGSSTGSGSAEPDVAAPVESEPLESEPLESEPLESEPLESEPAVAGGADSPALRPRELRVGALVDDPDLADDESDDPVPVAPAEPLVSANAVGIAATADPTPNATANAPTRPTNRA